jgi:hypothetical protein
MLSAEVQQALEALNRALVSGELSHQEVERLTSSIKNAYGRWAGFLGCFPNYQAIDRAIRDLKGIP